MAALPLFTIKYLYNGQEREQVTDAPDYNEAYRKALAGYGQGNAKNILGVTQNGPTQSYQVSYTTRDGQQTTSAIDAGSDQEAISKIGQFGGTNGSIYSNPASAPAPVTHASSTAAPAPINDAVRADGKLNIAHGTDPALTARAVARTSARQPAKDAALDARRDAYDASQQGSDSQGQVEGASTHDTTGLPSATLQPGQSGPEVKALQEWLIRNGYAIPDGPTGYYGTQTKAAVAALQQKLGVDPGQYPGYYGPITKTALAGNGGDSQQGQVEGASTGTQKPAVTSQDATDEPQQSPTSSFIETWQEVSDQLGLSDLKEEASKYAKESQDLENEMNDKIADVNENPWLTEGVRQKEVQRVQDRYATKLDTLSNYQKLYESLYEEGVSEAKWITSGVVDDQNRMMELAEKRIEAANKLETQIVEVGGQKVLIDQNTGETIKVLGASGSSSGSGSGSNRFTKTQLNTGSANAGVPLADFRDLDEEDQNYFINSYGTFKTMLSNYQAGKLTAKEMRANIENSNLSEDVKNVLLRKAGLTASSVQGTSTNKPSSGGNLLTKDYKQTVDEDILPVLGAGWKAITGLLGF